MPAFSRGLMKRADLSWGSSDLAFLSRWALEELRFVFVRSVSLHLPLWTFLGVTRAVVAMEHLIADDAGHVLISRDDVHV